MDPQVELDNTLSHIMSASLNIPGNSTVFGMYAETAIITVGILEYTEMGVELALGRTHPSGAVGQPFSRDLLACFEAGVARDVHHLRSWSTLTDLGNLASGTTAERFGDAMAIDDGAAWIGAPDSDDAALDGGVVFNFVNSGAGSLVFDGSFASDEPGDHFGRAIATYGDIAVISERNADLVSGGSGVGAVRVARRTAGSRRPCRTTPSPARSVSPSAAHSPARPSGFE